MDKLTNGQFPKRLRKEIEMKAVNRQKILKILSKRDPILAEKLMGVRGIMEIDHKIRDGIASVLSDEFVEHGLKDDDEPNAYGLEIEGLIGACRLTEE